MTAVGLYLSIAVTISAWNSDTSSQRRSPSGCDSTMRSAIPSTLAAAASSRVRTAPRSSPSTRVGSLTDPDSPRDPQMRTTRAPASASRASVPPQASDSSSGCANTASTVRPEKSATASLDDVAIDVRVLLDHAGDAEPRDGVLAHAAAIEIENARQLVGHLLQIVEHEPGHPVVDDFAHGALVEGGHRRAARHRFGEHEAERLARLDRIDQRARAAVEPHLGGEVGLAVVHDVAAV